MEQKVKDILKDELWKHRKECDLNIRIAIQDALKDLPPPISGTQVTFQRTSLSPPPREEAKVEDDDANLSD